ncbi:hypothetical protein MMC10_004379 [Thelotrema lepadinum]|nr:hypothetical protein [Thelotrema lepadinum]
MADSNTEAAQLSESQQDALATYLSVTNQESSEALPLLRRSQWNVQIAIAKFFDGEAPDPVEEARAAQEAAPPPPTRQSGHREVLLDGGLEFPRSSRRSPRDPAPRIVPQPDDRGVHKTPLLITLLFTPVSLVYKLFSTSLSFIGYLFPFLPRLLSNRNQSRATRRNTTGRRPLNPRDTAARFIREFGEEYGDHRLPFYENGYANAYDLAKKELKYLLVVLLSPEHDDTSTFIREVLLSSQFESLVKNPNVILWAGTVQDSEAYQVSIGLNCSKFPFAGLIVHTPQDSSTAMSTVARVTGLQPASSFVSKIRTAMSQHETALETARASRQEQQATRNLRQEQESAYERSLAQDRERMRIRREAEAARAREEAEAQAQADAAEKAAQNKEQWKRWKVQSILAEPGAEIKNATRLSIRMPSGDRVIRKFAPEATMEDLYAFVECHDVLDMDGATSQNEPPKGYRHEYKFNLVSPMPRAVYDLASGGTVAERIGRSGNLIVESTVDEDDDEE